MDYNLLNTDCHSHVLPHIDDGADNAKTSLSMLALLKEQGIDTVFATPHYRAHREDVKSFYERRDASARMLIEGGYSEDYPNIILGAEVAVEPGLADVKNIDALTLGNSPYILLEYPYREYNRRWTEEIENLVYRYDLTPVIAHLDRYAELFTGSDYAEILQINRAVFQINNEAFTNRYAKKLVKTLMSDGYPVVLGSDCHNLDSRMPNFDISAKKLKSVTPIGEAAKLLRSAVEE